MVCISESIPDLNDQLASELTQVKTYEVAK
jgi:hypothetical protein